MTAGRMNGSAGAPLLHVRDWGGRFENHRTRELRTLTWIPESTDLGSDTFAAILDHPDGPAHFGVAVGIHIAASKGVPRGYLRREDGRPHDAESLARLLRMPASLVKAAIDRLLEIGDLEIEKKNSRKSNSVASRTSAAVSRNGAVSARDSVPEGKGREGTEEKEQKEQNGIPETETQIVTEANRDEFLKSIGYEADRITDDVAKKIIDLDDRHLGDVLETGTLANLAARLLQFELSWDMYWRKESKLKARQSWMKVTETEIEELIASIQRAIEAQTPAMLSREIDKRPHFSTWLNNECWKDEAEPRKAAYSSPYTDCRELDRLEAEGLGDTLEEYYGRGVEAAEEQHA